MSLRPPHHVRRALLLGTALASSLLLAGLVAATPAAAQTTCTGGPAPGPTPIDENSGAPIVCNNDDPRDGDGTYDAIKLSTTGIGASITLNNGPNATLTSDFYGIYARVNRIDSPISIYNEATITSGSDSIHVETYTSNSVTIVNKGEIESIGGSGIYAGIGSSNSYLRIDNHGKLTTAYDGIEVEGARNSTVIVTNDADINADEIGISVDTGYSFDNSTSISNKAKITAGGRAGIYVYQFADSSTTIINDGELRTENAGIYVNARVEGNKVAITNTAPITSGLGGGSYGDAIRARVYGYSIAITNSGPLKAGGSGIYAYAKYGEIAVANSGSIEAQGDGIQAIIGCDYYHSCPYGYAGGTIAIANVGPIIAAHDGISAYTISGAIGIVNAGPVNAGGTGIYAAIACDPSSFDCADSPSGSIAIANLGTVKAGTVGIAAVNQFGSNLIVNAGSVFGGSAGIVSYSVGGTHIINTGTLSAASLLAIAVGGPGNALIENSGTITGYVLLDADDVFHNKQGGTFEARLTSDFGPGSDLFLNQGTVHTAANPSKAETTRFVNLERFQNQGTISLQDGKEGDRFEITNGGKGNGVGLSFSGSGRSNLAVDTFLGPPGSKSDVLVIDGDVSGRTGITVHNTNSRPGSYNPTGIPVVYVNGKTKGNEFFLPNGPIDTGFFDYDLFFKPTGSGVFYLRNFIGGGAYILPQLVTAAQDLFAATSETWLDRTADLRVLLNGGAPLAVPDLKGSGVTYTRSYDFTPAVWARGTGSWLNRDGNASTTVQGRSYRFDLDREFDIGDFQSGIDFGKRDLLAQGDILVFGFLGGGLFGSLDYDKLARHFTFSGAQAGGYFTYLNRGLFVDTLIKADFLNIEQSIAGFPDSIDATNFGIRTDSGYRFGGFRGGFFIEPQATIEVIWSDIDSFVSGGNSVSFDDDPNVRGRLGLRVGTSYEAWTGTIMEPFLIGSVWGNLSGDNHASLVSAGTTFNLSDDPGDAWGVISGGVNFFNPSANTSVFAKLDVSFGDDIDGLTGRVGMRKTW